MKKKKDLLNILLDIVEPFLGIYVLFMFLWFFVDRNKFYRWLFYGILFFIILLSIAIWKRKRRFKSLKGVLSDRELLLKLRGMNPNEFEEYVADLFNRLGYKTEVSGSPYDGGIDVVAEKDGVKHYIQCKKFITKEVGVGAIRDFYGAIIDRLANGKAYFITTNKFTLEAEKFAEDKPIELIDGFKLIKYIRLAEKDKIGNEENKSKICPKCGGKLIKKFGKYGNFWGCSNYPNCDYTKNF